MVINKPQLVFLAMGRLGFLITVARIERSGIRGLNDDSPYYARFIRTTE